MSLAFAPSSHHGGRFWLVALAVTVALVSSASDPCDADAMIHNCIAEYELCSNPCYSNNGFPSETCLEDCSATVDLCTAEVDDCSGCWDDEFTGQYSGDLCVPADAPLYTQPCLASSIAYRCSDELQQCTEASDFTTMDIDSCTDMLLECTERETAKCPAPAFGNDGLPENGDRFGNGSGTPGRIGPFYCTWAFALMGIATSVLYFGY